MDARLTAVIDEMPPLQARALRVALLSEEPPAHPPDPRVIAAAFRAALQALAVSAPVLVLVDDVQWLDQPSETAVGFAVRRLQDEAVGLLCAQRTDRPGARRGQGSRHTRQMVTPRAAAQLHVADVARLAGHATSRTTELVYRHQLRPVMEKGAAAMDRLFCQAG